jgi:hypothetical protein
MNVIAKFSIARPDLLAPHLDDEMRVLGELKAEGVIETAYRRAAGPGAISSSKDPASRPSENEWTPYPLLSRT